MAPALVRQCRSDSLARVDVHEDDGAVDISPQANLHAAATHIHRTVVETERLGEVGGAEKRRAVALGTEAETQPARFQQRVVLVEEAAAAEIDEKVALLYPHVHADVMTAAGHRLARVAARCCPGVWSRDIVSRCCQGDAEEDEHRQEMMFFHISVCWFDFPGVFMPPPLSPFARTCSGIPVAFSPARQESSPLFRAWMCSSMRNVVPTPTSELLTKMRP